MLELLGDADGLKDSTKVTITADLILSFQNTIGKPFVADLKANITRRFYIVTYSLTHCVVQDTYWMLSHL